MSRMDRETIKQALKVYFIMGSTNCLASDPGKILKEAINGGITLFQFREKGLNALAGKEKRSLAMRLQSICKEHGIPFIINDDIELAIELEADGVHIGQEDEPAEAVRAKIGDRILGVSVHSLEEAEAAQRAGADYFGIGPVFATVTKEDAKPERGTVLIEMLREKGFQVPIVGIGGIHAGNAASVIEAGADGVSVITAISTAKDAAAAAAELKKSVGV
ncbi:thiamine phosphate synthase [Heyndrickxia acidicola]|uniref:Thiamine-phosphate synthase n=1 Tax=Heyndrickxia acidicola TaxID=209389 RepID=A0ABU6MG13_9BACI|nr:thiamine phosphate synthase [Heyndrickxia acidicola]MED1203420.1 thiamine phosphate synthase [Heyndrickxia acidicola]